MSTAIQIIQSAAEEIGAFAPGESVRDADAERCLRELNGLMEIWSTQPQACFALLAQTFTLVSNKSRYSIGPGADVDSVRPMKVVQWFFTDTLGNIYDNQGIVEQFEWNNINRNPIVTGNVPNILFYDPQDPIGYLNFWPTPITPLGTITLNSYLQLTAFPNLTTPIALPPGYEAALGKNLAVSIAPFFGKTPSPVTVELASRYLGDIKRVNMRVIPASFDSAITARGRGYDIFSDSLV